MFGGPSIQIVRVFGIRIGVHPSWFIAFFLFIWWLSSYYKEVLPGPGTTVPFLLAVASALLFFVSVVLHELGHALVAMRNRITIAGIDLWLFGGVAKMTRDTPSASIEFRVAVAGPLVTLVITLICASIGILAGGGSEFIAAIQLKPAALNHWTLALLAYLTTINLVVLIFNLVPAYPLDGGRIARAIAWWRTGDKVRATNFAAQLGRGFSYILIGLGVFRLILGDLVGGIWLIFLGFILGQAAQGARLQTAVTARLEGVTVADVMDRKPVAIDESLDLARANEEYFLRYRYPWFPVIDAAGRYLGVITMKAMNQVHPARLPDVSVTDIMEKDRGGSLKIREDEVLEALLGQRNLERLGALMAVDAMGCLRGVITVDHLRRALQDGGPSVMPQ